MKTAGHGTDEQDQGGKVVPFPREWIGPPEALVPLRAPEADEQDLGAGLAADQFWSEGSASLQQAVQMPALPAEAPDAARGFVPRLQGGSEPHPDSPTRLRRAFGRHKGQVIAACSAVAALSLAGAASWAFEGSSRQDHPVFGSVTGARAGGRVTARRQGSVEALNWSPGIRSTARFWEMERRSGHIRQRARPSHSRAKHPTGRAVESSVEASAANVPYNPPAVQRSTVSSSGAANGGSASLTAPSEVVSSASSPPSGDSGSSGGSSSASGPVGPAAPFGPGQMGSGSG